MSSRFQIWSNGFEVGSLDSKGSLSFSYSAWWIENKGNLPISTSLPVKSGTYSGPIVYDFFDNLLPDSNEFRAQLANYYGVSNQVGDLLGEIGRDCVGALQILPAGAEPPEVHLPSGNDLSDLEVEQILQDLYHRGHPKSQTDFRISLAGAQKKTALLKWDEKWKAPTGSTPTTHILKLPIGLWRFSNGVYDFQASVANEAFCLLLARKMGISAARCEIGRFGKTTALIVERFDRFLQHGKLYRIFQEDLCQAFGLPASQKYGKPSSALTTEGVLDFLSKSNNKRDRLKFLCAQLFNLLVAGGDAHGKNFSILRSRNGFALAPLYDLVSFYGVLSQYPHNKNEIKLGIPLKKGPKNLFDIKLKDLTEGCRKTPDLEEGLNDFLNKFKQEIEQKMAETVSELGMITPEEEQEISWIKKGILDRLDAI